MNGFLNWLLAQMAGIPATIQAVIANKPEPAMNVVGQLLMLSGAIWLVLKIVKLASK